jgi:hypothetical protein
MRTPAPDFWLCFPLWLAAFIVINLVVTAFLAYASGWSSLAEKYKAVGHYQADWRWFRSLVFPNATYSRAVFIGYAEDGLLLDLFFPFKYRHPRLFIPRSEIVYKGPIRRLWLEYEGFGFVSCPEVVMGMFKQDSAELKQRFGLLPVAGNSK